MWNVLYNLGLLLAFPVIVAVLVSKPRCRRGLRQRLGMAPPAPDPSGRPVVWIHAVSLGEAVAVTPLVLALHHRHPELRFMVSTVTETGREAVEQRLAGIAEHCYAPLDFPWAVSRTIASLRPIIYIFVETELWPNLLRSLSLAGVPTVMVNGRLSTRSFARQQWKPVRAFYRPMLRSLRLCLMQSDRDVERIVALGADPAGVRRTGNIKFDQMTPSIAGQRDLREALGFGPDDLLIVAGSTHPGEEEALMGCYHTIIERYPTARLIVAPRHIERSGQVESLARDRGFTVRRRSAIEGRGRTDKPQVLVLDSRGELAAVYREALVAFVGGTLVPVGGHNLLEPAVWGKPVVFGPHTDHCAEIANLLLQARGGVRVTDETDLTGRMMALFEQIEERHRMGQAALSVVKQNQGALEATLEAIEQVLTADSPRPSPPVSAPPLSLVTER
ncbi:3-deoxy-D-manno-octulosonic-acid transferase [Nitrospira sp. KM1]|uniref:3-deoxy-D-manno-octulosonic acid transferase n=1 Tax=Nitrospira sp. KM1 TaxID=1936990 RepID=UPI0013A71016|nr:3-deoxy-D-manno-octulosonic acid transferase [Nitrospira sp. KM1]BCA54248.1 3-deoxy-D-manno-octulosonic-acid transferase [Nitrospira sp. KM1]